MDKLYIVGRYSSGEIELHYESASCHYKEAVEKFVRCAKIYTMYYPKRVDARGPELSKAIWNLAYQDGWCVMSTFINLLIFETEE